MRRHLQNLHFHTDQDDVVVEVFQDDAAVATQCDEIFTEGLGPCIGVAFSRQGSGFMFHGAGIHHTNDFEEFLDLACRSLPASDRLDVRPVVAGGDVTGGVGNDVLRSRLLCLTRLKESGFAEPHVRWCPDHHAQALYLDVHTDTVRVHTQPTSPSKRTNTPVEDIVNR